MLVVSFPWRAPARAAQDRALVSSLHASAHPAASNPARLPPKIEERWFEPASELRLQVERAQRRALEVGVDSLEPAAHALLMRAVGEDALERTQLAVDLAPASQ